MAAKHKNITIEIESLAAGGDGVGHIDGKVCFVPLAAPGDRLRIRVVRENERLVRGIITEILEQGASRREPACPLFGQCGGCQWLHVDSSAQLLAKRSILSRALKRADVQVVSSPKQLGYRRLARLHFDPQRGALGFARAGQRTIIDLDKCPILDPALGRCLELTKSILVTETTMPVEVRLAVGDDAPVVSVSSPSPLPAGFYSRAMEITGDRIAGVVVSVDGLVSTIAGEANILALCGDGEPLFEPVVSFGQANREVNHILAKTVTEWVEGSGYSSALELFAGSGNLTVCIARHIKKVATVEKDRDACLAARKNIEQRALRGVTVHEGDALEVYREIGNKFDLVVLDPPRTGHRELARALAQGEHRAVLYVSCNPATLARDLLELASGGFRLTRCHGFDMFPQTAHLEAAALMER
ncbi:MAG: class I SAM-dependent RNA methyltransferase [Deltaproteobacteria bacterium]|nr:class I SAM-dependent RNA methyltransferase [Deltaproteobacteria bacterium]